MSPYGGHNGLFRLKEDPSQVELAGSASLSVSLVGGREYTAQDDKMACKTASPVVGGGLAAGANRFPDQTKTV